MRSQAHQQPSVPSRAQAAIARSSVPPSKLGIRESTPRHFDFRSVPMHAPAIVSDALQSSSQPLDQRALAHFGARFGHDFRRVRVHADALADASAASLRARAYTVGEDVVFRSGAFAPHTNAGHELLGHELAHVVQQSNAVSSTSTSQPGTPNIPILNDASAEREAVDTAADGARHAHGAVAGAGAGASVRQLGRVGVQCAPDPAVVDPEKELGPVVAKRWKSLYEEIWNRSLALTRVNQVSRTVERTRWINELHLLLGQLGEVTTEPALALVESSYRAWETKMFDVAFASDELWQDTIERAEDEQVRLAEGASTAGTYAFEYLTKEIAATKRRLVNVDSDLRVSEDSLALKALLDNDTHLWYGELRAARERVADLMAMLQVVGTLRGAGEDDAKLVPGWKDRVRDERIQLLRIAAGATKRDYRVAFEGLAKELDADRSAALARHKREKGFAEKGFDLVSGALSAIVDPFVEAGKQVVDLAQIVLHFASLTHYQPSFKSDMGKAAEQGAGTADILKGVIKNLIGTPKRLWTAIENDDWNAIGRETVNLYLLAKTGKEGAAKAVPLLRLVRARAVGLRGGMGAAAALEVLKIAKKEGLVIRFRMNEAPAIRLRELGHPAKPEFLKMKSIKEADTHLGANEADLGKVAYFKPKLPANLKQLGTKLQGQVNARFQARMKEWHKYKSEVQSLEARGLIKIEGDLVVDPQSGKAFTGDYDLFDIRKGSTSGQGVEFESLSKSVQDRLKASPVEAQHGSHLDWKEIPAGAADMFAEIILDARPTKNAKPLIEFHPDGRIRYTYFVD